MLELTRKVKKTVEETFSVELKATWVVRVLRPNGNRTYYCLYEQEFDNEPSEREIADILVQHSNLTNEFVGVCKNYRLVEVEVKDHKGASE